MSVGRKCCSISRVVGERFKCLLTFLRRWLATLRVSRQRFAQHYNMVWHIVSPGSTHFGPRFDTFWPLISHFLTCGCLSSFVIVKTISLYLQIYFVSDECPVHKPFNNIWFTLLIISGTTLDPYSLHCSGVHGLQPRSVIEHLPNCPAAYMRWLWCLMLFMIIPYICIIARDLWLIFFKNEPNPRRDVFIVVCWNWSFHIMIMIGIIILRHCLKHICALLTNPQLGSWHRQGMLVHGPLARYVTLWVTHAPAMPGTFSLPTRVSDPDMHHGTCVIRTCRDACRDR